MKVKTRPENVIALSIARPRASGIGIMVAVTNTTTPARKLVMAEDLLCGDSTLEQDGLFAEGHWLIGRLRTSKAALSSATRQKSVRR